MSYRIGNRLGLAPPSDFLALDKPMPYQPPPGGDGSTNGNGGTNGGTNGATETVPRYSYSTTSGGAVKAYPLNAVAETSPPPAFDQRGGFMWRKAPYGAASEYWSWKQAVVDYGEDDSPPTPYIPPGAADGTITTPEGDTYALPLYVPPGISPQAFAPAVQQAGIGDLFSNPLVLGGLALLLVMGLRK